MKGRLASRSPEIQLSSKWSRAAPKPTGRPIRSTRGKRTSLNTNFIDSSILESETDSGSDDDDDEKVRPSKKPRLQTASFIKEEYEPEARQLSTPTSSSSSSSKEFASATPEREPEPDPWDLKYYPKTYSAAEKFKKVLGAPPPDTDDLDVAIDALKQKATTGISPTKKTLIVTLPLPRGIIFKNTFFDPNKVGFMDFPGEIRNQIYSLALKKPGNIHFRSRLGFSHSGAFLRVNKAVYDEARSVLYSENRFVFEQSFNKTGAYYDHQWKEVNYAYIRKFLTDIGPENTGLITNVGLKLEDATPSGHPGTDMDARRYENNKDLYWILKHLGRYGKIQKLKLCFSGRRNLQFYKGEAAFLYALKGVKTDELHIGDPDIEGRDMPSWDLQRHNKVATTLRDALEGLMVRPAPLEQLDPRLEF